MPKELETDYLVIGAGAAGMAFADELLTHTDASIAIVDRRHAPGGHWLDAYPFVRLHQPSTFYGVSSVPLGEDTIDTRGMNEGFYELAGADELRAYYERVMHRRFLPTGRVRWFPCSELVDEGRVVSHLSGASFLTRVRRKVIDAGYLQGSVPATSPPPFEVEEGVRCVPPSALTSIRADSRPDRYVIIGAGKTALDACNWLMEQGVDPSIITWIRPREAWWMNRKFQQPRTLVPDLFLGGALQLEAMAEATSVDDAFARMEAAGIFFRIDGSLTPTMFRGAIATEREIASLRRITDVVRMGHVRRIERDAIILDGGRVPTRAGTLYVHCASRGLGRPSLRPIFEPGRVTIQPQQWGFACYEAASLAVIEATIESDEEENTLARPIPYWDKNKDFLEAFLALMVNERARAANPALGQWMRSTRLNPASSLTPYRERDDVKRIRERIKRVGLAAVLNLQKLTS